MYKSIRIQNFRGFEDLEIKDLARVNLIAGKNNVGKTSVLDAILLHAGKVDIENTLRIWKATSPKSRNFFAFPFALLFNNLDMSQSVIIDAVFSFPEIPYSNKQLEISSSQGIEHYLDAKNARLGQSEIQSKGLRLQYSGVVNKEKKSTDKKVIFRLTGSDEFVVSQISEPQFPVEYINTTGSDYVGQADKYSDFIRRNEQHIVLDVLKSIDESLKDLQILSVSGFPIIHANLGLHELLPLSSLGDGIQRITDLALEIGATSGGILAIDEIENGLHYSVLEDVWKAIGEAARQFNTQIFATTHSQECITAAQTVFADTDDLRVIQLASGKDGRIDSLTYNREMLDATLEVGLEVRS